MSKNYEDIEDYLDSLTDKELEELELKLDQAIEKIDNFIAKKELNNDNNQKNR